MAYEQLIISSKRYIIFKKRAFISWIPNVLWKRHVILKKTTKYYLVQMDKGSLKKTFSFETYL